MYYAIYARGDGDTADELVGAVSFADVSDACPIYAYASVKERADQIALAARQEWNGYKMPARTFARLDRRGGHHLDCNSRVWAREGAGAIEATRRLLDMDGEARHALQAEYPGYFGEGPALSDRNCRDVWDRIAPDLSVLRPASLTAGDLRRMIDQKLSEAAAFASDDYDYAAAKARQYRNMVTDGSLTDVQRSKGLAFFGYTEAEVAAILAGES